MDGNEHILTCVDIVGGLDSQTMFPTELKLKKTTVVILLRNTDIKAGHCNGTRYLVKEIGKYRLLLEKLNQTKGDKNTTLLLPRIPMRYGGNSSHFN